jgi:hypothetical protein
MLFYHGSPVLINMSLNFPYMEKMKKEEKEKEGVEVRTGPKADERTRDLAEQLVSIFNGPLFEKAVRQAVEEMVMEGKLTYDLDNDTVDTPLAVVKRKALEMERENKE